MCLLYLRSCNHHKLEYTTDGCIFLGYISLHNGYQCLHSSGRVYVSNHVIFDEPTFPFQSAIDFSSVSAACQPSLSGPCLSHVSPSLTQQTAAQLNLSIPQSPMVSASDFHHSPLPLSASLPASPTTLQTLSPVHSPQPYSPVSPPPHISPPQQKPTRHSMITRSKAGVFNPKIYTTTSLSISAEFTTVAAVITDPKWYKAMTQEYKALIDNKTWTLVPASHPLPVVGNKWVFRIKYNYDGSEGLVFSFIPLVILVLSVFLMLIGPVTGMIESLLLVIVFILEGIWFLGVQRSKLWFLGPVQSLNIGPLEWLQQKYFGFDHCLLKLVFLLAPLL